MDFGKKRKEKKTDFDFLASAFVLCRPPSLAGILRAPISFLATRWSCARDPNEPNRKLQKAKFEPSQAKPIESDSLYSHNSLLL
ncbi:hypothetical protein OUZ56_000279 [Daphnia magna]|uniref:Uncharacterized protein n=1 Tax=Daphnia magna TaxID=35525 RepID=A0ABQ9ZZ70_9CRUS|nr:hypothetical protein OUZ56_000279 [Daphnia magna]